MIGDERRELDQRLDVTGLGAPCARRPRPRVHLLDPVCLLRAEAQPEPRADLVVEVRHQRVVARAALVDPSLRRERVEIADELRLGRRVAGRLDPDVRAPGLIVLSRPEEEPGHLPVAERDRARRVFLRPQRGDLRAGRVGVLEPLREQRLGGAVLTMPGRQQRLPPRRGGPPQTHESRGGSPADRNGPTRRMRGAGCNA